MQDVTFEVIEGEPSLKDKKIIVNGLLAHHPCQGHPRESKTFSILLKDNDKTIGGITCTVLWNGMEINSLWVDESIRGKNWGRKLVEMAEEEAIKRGCTIAYTNTFSWQAPEFYTKLGYKEYGKLENFPEGNSLTYFRKN